HDQALLHPGACRARAAVAQHLRMKIDAHQFAVALAPGALLALLGLGLGAVFAATLAPDERAVLGDMIAPRAPLLVLGWAVLAIALGALARRAHAIWVTEPARLAEAAQA